MSENPYPVRMEILTLYVLEVHGPLTGDEIDGHIGELSEEERNNIVARYREHVMD